MVSPSNRRCRRRRKLGRVRSHTTRRTTPGMMMRARRVRRRESSSHDDFFRSLSLMIFVCDDVFFYKDLFCCGSRILLGVWEKLLR